MVVASFVAPRVGGTERFVEWLRTTLPPAGLDVRVLSVDFPGTSADATVPHRTSQVTGVPVVLPTPAVLQVLRREVAAADVVLLQSALHPLSLWAGMIARAKGTPALTVVHTAQNYPHGVGAGALAARAYDIALPAVVLRLAAPVSLSWSTDSFLRDTYGIEPVATLPFPLAGLPAIASAERSPGPLRVVCVSRLSPEKDLASVVRACDGMGDLLLDVYGDGPDEAAVRALAETRPWLTVHGATPWAEVIAAQAASDVCLSAALMENVGVAILEALAVGTPVVTTAIGDAPRYLPRDLCVARDGAGPPGSSPQRSRGPGTTRRRPCANPRARARASGTPRAGAHARRHYRPPVTMTRGHRSSDRPEARASAVAPSSADDAAEISRSRRRAARGRPSRSGTCRSAFATA